MSSAAAIPVDEQRQLVEDLAGFAHDPLGAVLYGFPWGKDELADAPGPRMWQAEILREIGEHLSNPETCYQPCQIAISSGHDIGKSSLISMITWWALSTFEDCRGTITANTDNQLKTKTSPEIAKWLRLAINSGWFDKNVTSLKSQDEAHKETWRMDLVPWSEQNPAAAAGLHNKGKRLLLVFDEASEIPFVIFETGEGVMLDENTEIIWIVCGNPTQNQGPFYQAAFGRNRHRWKVHVIDSREVEGTNKAKLEQWLEDYGEDSDFFRVRARGLPPRASDAQFIDTQRVLNAQKRVVQVASDEPLVCGVDFAWGGSDDNVCRFRCGNDARSIQPIRVKGEFTREPHVMTNRLADVLSTVYVVDGVQRKVAKMFCDSAGISSRVVAGLRKLGFGDRVIEINFGADSPDPHQAYYRDYMWDQLKNWLPTGAIDADPQLETDLTSVGLMPDKMQRVKLEPKEHMKARGIDSPDDGDALALTFAMPVGAPERAPEVQSVSWPSSRSGGTGWMA